MGCGVSRAPSTDSDTVRAMKRALATALLIVGCGGGTIIISGIEVYEGIWEDTVRQLSVTAAFDMGVPD
ncbi:MAG: hypothetical protein ACI9KE_003449 [Polyangiales bacterium]